MDLAGATKIGEMLWHSDLPKPFGTCHVKKVKGSEVQQLDAVDKEDADA